MQDSSAPLQALRLPNIRRFIAFRILFNARFYYPVFTIIFLDFGLSLEQFALLNTIWALTIVGLEVPSGALADTIGRKNLVVLAAAIMLVEIALVAFAPSGGGPIVFWLFVANRILSGTAEAAASGADEALAYDSLKALGIEDQWSSVLERQMKLQSLAFVAAMSLGAILYDHQKLNAILAFIGLDLELAATTTMRLPLFGTLAFAVAALFVTLGLKEPANPDSAQSSKKDHTPRAATAQSFRATLLAGKWILATPLAFAIILSGLLFDHMVRMVLTLNSEFYRQIELPEFSFGFIGAGLAMLGVVIPKLGRLLAERRSRRFNFALLALAVAGGLWGMARFVPYWSALAMIPLYAGIFLNGYFVSYYLNQITESRQRATVLSFKGLAFNLAYGTIGFAYAAAVSHFRQAAPANLAANGDELGGYLFRSVFSLFPAYFIAAALAVAIAIAALRRTKQTA